jgi:hypothetical protein
MKQNSDPVCEEKGLVLTQNENLGSEDATSLDLSISFNPDDVAEACQGLDVEQDPLVSDERADAADEPTNEDGFPVYKAICPPAFSWGETSGEDFTNSIDFIYEKVVFWRKNHFELPNGALGKVFTRCVANLFRQYVDAGNTEGVALKAIAVMNHLLLQKTHGKAKAKQNKIALNKRLNLWNAGNVRDIYDECAVIQKRLEKQRKKMSKPQLANTFAKLIFVGRTGAALRLLDQQCSAGVQDLTDEVLGVLNGMHQVAARAEDDTKIKGNPPPSIHPVIFEPITAEEIKEAAKLTRGAAGPSGGDAEHWRRMLFNFKSVSNDLAEAMANTAKRLCTSFVDPQGLSAFLANRLIPLDKNPGTRPIGVGEIMRRIIGKTVMRVIKNDVMEATGTINLCTGQKAGVEAIIHAMTELFKADETDALLLMDGENAFNQLNRAVALHNIRYICPAISIILINYYRASSRLFISGGKEIASKEGTTQGCPLSMAFYALGILPLTAQAGKYIERDEGEDGGEERR